MNTIRSSPLALMIPVALLCSPAWRSANADEAAGASTLPPKVCIAHRGASAYVPEHTLLAYRKAIHMGADYVEQDLQITKDGVLVCLHDKTLERTTNVAVVFPDRATGNHKGRKSWLVVDFTLAELRQLDAGIHFGEAFDGNGIPTFQEALDLVREHHGIGIYPEMKDAGFYRQRGIVMEKLVAEFLDGNDLGTPEGQAKTPVLVQSFEPDALKKFREITKGRYRLVQLVSRIQGKSMLSDFGLRGIREYAEGVGPSIDLIADDKSRVAMARELGLVMHPYTVDWNRVPDLFPDARSWMDHLLYEVGVDGVFTNNPDLFPRFK